MVVFSFFLVFSRFTGTSDSTLLWPKAYAGPLWRVKLISAMPPFAVAIAARFGPSDDFRGLFPALSLARCWRLFSRTTSEQINSPLSGRSLRSADGFAAARSLRTY